MQYCDLCNIDAPFYSANLRAFEGAAVCFYCWLDVLGTTLPPCPLRDCVEPNACYPHQRLEFLDLPSPTSAAA